ncbi:MAG TPA: ribose-phosphate pyrophosphokinase [Firmicutes bacterium]|nr:ribose-phosphate pyrophosphokinase [Bacillota bacterium]
MELKIFSGSAHPELAVRICRHLGTEEGRREIFKFSNDCTFVKILESVRNDDVYVIQPSCAPVNDGLMELLIMIDALHRASAARITAVLPYFPYAKSDKKDQPRIAITARLVANLLETAGIDRVLTMDLHAPQIMGFFSVPVDHLTSVPILSAYYQKLKEKDVVVVAPDAGRAKLARTYGKLIGAPIALLDKQRVGNEEKVEVNHLVGEVKGRPVLLVEDEIASGGTMMAEAEFLHNAGATEIFVACTHGVFSGKAIERIASSPITEIAVTDTLPLAPERRIEKITVLSVAELFAEAITRIHKGQSVSVLFD